MAFLTQRKRNASCFLVHRSEFLLCASLTAFASSPLPGVEIIVAHRHSGRFCWLTVVDAPATSGVRNNAMCHLIHFFHKYFLMSPSSPVSSSPKCCLHTSMQYGSISDDQRQFFAPLYVAQAKSNPPIPQNRLPSVADRSYCAEIRFMSVIQNPLWLFAYPTAMEFPNAR